MISTYKFYDSFKKGGNKKNKSGKNTENIERVHRKKLIVETI